MTEARYFDPVKMAKRQRWTTEETGQALIAIMGYQILQDEDVCALYPKAELDARVRAVSEPGKFSPYIQLSNWLSLRRQEIQLNKVHAMNMIQLLWRSLYISLTREVAKTGFENPAMEKKRRALVDAPMLSRDQQPRTIQVLFSDLRRICAFNTLLDVVSRRYHVDTFGYVVDWESEFALYDELTLLNSVSDTPLKLFDVLACDVPEANRKALQALLSGGYQFTLSDLKPLELLLA